MHEWTPQQIEAWESARRSRDARFDGRFFIGVLTTGIYCRPVCPARTPKSENVRFFTTAASAAEAGFRPCLRCRPETAPGSPAWRGSSNTVRRALRLIESGQVGHDSVESLAGRLGVTDRHLRRLFQRDLGASPLSVLQTQRLQIAKRLIDNTRLPMKDIAIAAGYPSVRRFNHELKRCYQRSPRELRRRRAPLSSGLTLELGATLPFDADALFAFIAPRAVPGVEAAEPSGYERALDIDGQASVIRVVPGDRGVSLELRSDGVASLPLILQAVRNQFDLDAPIAEIDAWLDRDPMLGSAASKGCRVPGTANLFELVVRAVLGQQVSVAAATTLAGRVAERYGERLPEPVGRVTHLFPTPARLARARFNGLGITGARIRTIQAVARAIVAGDLALSLDSDPAELRASLLAIRGIGPWTADYILMRGLKDPDAFPAADLGLVKAASDLAGSPMTAKELQDYSERWRPWRAYAALRLWNHLPSGG